MQMHQAQSHSLLCLLLALSVEACVSQSGQPVGGEVAEVAPNQSALETSGTALPTAATIEVAADDPAPLTEEERRARMEIAHETVGELSQARQREYRRAEKAALRAALPAKRAALAQADASRPAGQSRERDALDAKISRLRSNIDAQSRKLQDLEMQPD